MKRRDNGLQHALHKAGLLPKPHKGWPNHRHKKDTHAEKKLRARIRDYDMMVGRVGWKAPVGSYHKPGSNK